MIAVLGTLGGVALGFFLNFYWQKRRDEELLTKKRRAIESELRTNASLMPQKIDLLQKIKNELQKGKLLRGSSVRFPAHCYTNYIGEVSVSLTDRQRENLVVIYETLRIVDKFMDNLFSEYIELYKSKALPGFGKSYTGDLASLIDECWLAKKLIEEYLAGKPRKIAWDELPQWE